DSPAELEAPIASTDREFGFRSLRELSQRMARQRANDASFDVLRQTSQRVSRLVFSREHCKRATAGSAHPRMRRSLPERPHGIANDGELRRCGGLEVVLSVTFGKDVYFPRRRHGCQLKRGKNVSCRNANRRHCKREPIRWHRYGCEPISDAARERGFAADKKRHVGAERRTDRGELASRQSKRPQAIQREQHARGVRAAAAESGAERNAFADPDRHAAAASG